MKMKFSLNVAIQMLALVAQGLNASIDLLPGRGKFWAMVGLSLVQGLTAVLAHFVNPDGTPAKVRQGGGVESSGLAGWDRAPNHEKPPAV
jgi:hypothetical protein